jgi:hypothetical protein
MYDKLKSFYGYDDENIYYLYEYSKERSNTGGRVDGDATESNFKTLMAHLASIMQAGDHIYLYFVGHGGGAYWTLGIDGNEMAAVLDALPSQNISLAMNFCNSGAFIPYTSGPGRCVATAVQANESDGGWAECWRDSIGGDRPAIDTNGDGKYSFLEVYLETVVHAAGNGGYHPQLDDNGDGVSHHPDYPGGLGDDGAVAATRHIGDDGLPLSYSAQALQNLATLNASLNLDP